MFLYIDGINPHSLTKFKYKKIDICSTFATANTLAGDQKIELSAILRHYWALMSDNR